MAYFGESFLKRRPCYARVFFSDGHTLAMVSPGTHFIYAILFLPELNQFVLGRVRPSRNDESDNAGIEMPFEYLLPMVAAAAVALIFSLLVAVSWPVCLMLMGAGAALVGGVAFTFFQMHSLGLPQKARAPDRVVRSAAESKLRTQRQMLVKQAACEYEPCPHHENYPESPGEDQGQLTSHLPGSTPFFDELNAPISWRIIGRFLAQNQRGLYKQD
jgi:hypothetical protein